MAVDDAGAGIANFNHLLELRPAFVKIDIGLVRGVDADPGRRAVVAALIHFAAESGCQVIAEGIETEAELATLEDLDVTLGQGYLLARPAPVDEWIATRGAATRRLGPGARAFAEALQSS
jgi:EAL domain-containing protein (putative c-di-GMP-specific phosphodiesterase class I)